MSFSIYRPLRQSTSVDYSVTCSFTQPSSEELVVCRVNVLEVWRPSTQQSQMQLVTSFELSGEVNSVSRFSVSLDSFTLEEQAKWKHRLPEQGLDCLVLSFDEAKITLVCFDPLRPRTLRTVALFNFEETAKGSELRASKVGLVPTPPAAFGSRAYAMVDPEHRAICTVVYSSFLAVIPIRQIIPTEEDDSKSELIRVLAGSDDDDDDDDDDDEDEEDAGDAEHEMATQQLRTNKPVSFGGRVLKRKSTLKRECGNDHPMFGTPHLLPLSAYGIGQHCSIAACFAEDAFTPTLLVLYSNPVKSWAARLSVYEHTCNVCAISLCPENPLAASRAWLCDKLPHDSLNLLPVKNQSGGALVVTTSALIYINSVPRERVTMAVNAFAVNSCFHSKANPIFNMHGSQEEGEEQDTCFTFAATSAAVWISAQTLLCVLARGELLQVCLSSPALHSSRVKMTCKLVGAIGGTAFTCSAVLPSKQLLFFGSRSTDGVFLSYLQEEPVFMPTENKRVKVEHEEEEFFAANDDFDEMLAEIQPETASEENLLLTLEIVDYLPVFGPITDMDYSDALPTNPLVSQALAQAEDEDILHRAEREAKELLASGKSHAAQHVRAQAQQQVAENKRKRDMDFLRRDVDLITVGTKTRFDSKCFSYTCGYRVNLRHMLALLECSLLTSVGQRTLVVSESSKTRVFTLVSESEVAETRDHMLCNAKAATLFAGVHLASGNLIQVLPKEIKLFTRGGKLLHNVALERGEHVSQVAFEQNLLVVLLSNSRLRTFAITPQLLQENKTEYCSNVSACSLFTCPQTRQVRVCVIKTSEGDEEPGTFEVYDDKFQLTFRSDNPIPLAPSCIGNALLGAKISASTSNVDTGDRAHRAGVLLNTPVVDFIATRVGPDNNCKILLIAALADGEMCVYERQQQQDVWHKVNHSQITRGLRGRPSRARRYAQPSKAFRGPVLHAFVHDLHAHAVFFGGHRPCFILCHLGRVSVVPLASSVACTLPPPLVPVPMAAAAAATLSKTDEDATAAAPAVPGPNEIYRARGAVHAFCTVDSLFIFALRAPEPSIKTAEPLKSTALWFCTSALDSAEDFTSGVPASAHALPHPEESWNCTHVVYLPHASRGSKEEQKLSLHAPTFAMISSRDETLAAATAAATVAARPENDAAEEEEDEGPMSFAYGGEPDIVIVRQTLDICRSPDFSITCSSFALDPDERVVSMMTTNLDLPPGSELYVAMQAEKDPRPQHHGVVVLGTGYINAKGEDSGSKGRILVFTIDHVPVPGEGDLQRREGRPSSRPMLRMIASVELRGPISALASLEGRILAAAGSMPCSVKLLELSSRNEGLIQIGFYDSLTCVVSINVIRDQFVLLGDMNKSIHFIRWKDRQFHCLAKSFDNVKAFASEFVVDGSRLLLTAADDEANFRVWHYDPEGQFLQVRGEINIGVRVGKMKAKRMAALPPKQQTVDDQDGGAVAAAAAAAAAQQEQAATRWCLIMGTLAGGLSSLVPLEEKVFRRLDLLQQAMVASALIPRNAGLHPMQCSQPRVPKRPTHSKSLRNASTTIIDGRVIWKFIDLEKVVQIKLAMSIGSTVESILDTLLEIDLVSTW